MIKYDMLRQVCGARSRGCGIFRDPGFPCLEECLETAVRGLREDSQRVSPEESPEERQSRSTAIHIAK